METPNSGAPINFQAVNTQPFFKPTLMQKLKAMAPQILRFAVVGVINTAINFAILNLLSMWTGVEKGAGIIPITAVAFLGATINSYILNKHWTFKDKSTGQGAKQFSVFLMVSIIGLLINISTVYLITSFVPASILDFAKGWTNISTTILLLNLANLVATGLSLVWNFVGYKLIVFRGK